MQRIARRNTANQDLSEARPEHYDRLKAGIEPVRGWPSSLWTRLPAGGTPEQVSRAALDVLRREWSIHP